MYKDIHFSIGSTESTVKIEKFIQEYFLSKSFCFKGGVIFPKPVWDGKSVGEDEDQSLACCMFPKVYFGLLFTKR